MYFFPDPHEQGSLRPTVSSGMRWSWDRRAALSGDWQAPFNEWVDPIGDLIGCRLERITVLRFFFSSGHVRERERRASPVVGTWERGDPARGTEGCSASIHCAVAMRTSISYQRGAAIEQAQPAAEKCAQESKPAARGALKVSEIAAATQSPTTTPAKGIATSWSLGSVTSIAIASMLPATAAAMSIASPTRWKKAIRAELDAALTGAVDAFTPERLAAPRRSLSALGQTRGVTATRRRQEWSIARVISG